VKHTNRKERATGSLSFTRDDTSMPVLLVSSLVLGYLASTAL